MIPVRLQHMTKIFDRTRAVDDVTIDVAAGELFFLLGPSGCGKTTLLRCVAGFCDPDHGTIWFGERDITRVPAHKRDTGMVFQSYALWPHYTVAENVSFGLEVRHIDRSARRQKVARALELVRMSELADRSPNQLSGGQQQRVALARALVVEPQCLLLDEPLSNLDARLRAEMRSEIRRICKEARLTGIYVTHDQKEALSMADRIAVMNTGRIEQIGTPTEIYRRPRNRFVAEFIGEANFIPAQVVAVDQAGVTCHTAFGRLQASSAHDQHVHVGQTVTLLVRPEAIRLDSSAPNNAFLADLGETTYLGEMAEHRLATAEGAIALKACELNLRATRPHQRLTCHVALQDVTILVG